VKEIRAQDLHNMILR